MANGSAFLKRLGKLEELIRWWRPRFIVIAVPASEGELVTAETAAVAQIEHDVAVGDDDQVIYVTKFCDRQPPKLISIV